MSLELKGHPGLDALGFLREFSLPESIQTKPTQRSNSFLNQRLQVVLKHQLHHFLPCLNFCWCSFSSGLLITLTRRSSCKTPPYRASCCPEKAPGVRPAVGVGNAYQTQLLQPQINADSQPRQHLSPDKAPSFVTQLLVQAPRCIYGQHAEF